MVLEPHLDRRVGDAQIRMMPRRFGEMPDGVDHHERAPPAVRLVLAADVAALERPMRHIARKPRLDLGLAICAFLRLRCHGATFLTSRIDEIRSYCQAF